MNDHPRTSKSIVRRVTPVQKMGVKDTGSGKCCVLKMKAEEWWFREGQILPADIFYYHS